MMDKSKNEFINKIVLKLVKYEPERKKRLSKLINENVIAIIIALIMLSIITVCFMMLCFKFKDMAFEFGLYLFFPVIVLFLILGFVLSSLRTSCDKEFKKYLKDNCQKDILQTFNLESIKEEGFSMALLQRSNLFSNFSRVTYDDVIKGNYNNVDYTIAESELILNGSKSDHTIFKGVIISFKSNKKVASDTLIVPKGAKKLSKSVKLTWVMAGVIQLFTVMSFYKDGDIVPVMLSSLFFVLFIIAMITNRNKMQGVKLEDTDFEKRFDVFTQNQIEARYVITTAFMVRLKSLETSFGTKGIRCSFFHEQIMIAIPTEKDLFEVGSVFKPLGSTKNIEEFYDEITSIQNMIDHFKLAEKTGL